MTTKVSTPRPIQITPGVQPSTDWSGAATSHYVYTKGVQFVNGVPQKAGGFMRQNFDYSLAVSGVIRTIFTDLVNGKNYQILGTNTNLYSLLGSRLADITPAGLAAGEVNENVSQGYGAGYYGVGLYGTALLSSQARRYPRIWIIDRYANTFIMTPGNQTGLYQWFGDATVKPQLVANAPTAINYAFVVPQGLLVTFGAGGIENRIYSSDFDITVWTSSSTNQVFDDDVEGAGRLVSHCPSQDMNLIFTENKTYTFRYIGGRFVWEILPLDSSVGIIAPMARVSAKGDAYWMSKNNFHYYRGGRVETIKANSQEECTALRYVFDNMNIGQKSKIFAWFNPKYNEVCWHFPSTNSNEPDRVVRVNIDNKVWTLDELPRTAAEYPSVKSQNPYLANVGMLYKHEMGNDADGLPLEFDLIGPKQYNGKGNVLLTGVIPDSIQTGTVNFTATGYKYPQSKVAAVQTSTKIKYDTEFVQFSGQARYYQYRWQGKTLGQNWEMGIWYDDVQAGSPQ